MNYRHAFHAGNFADVVKHAVLALLIERLKEKDGAFRVIDTHAGTGIYDLAGPEAGRTLEWRSGIGRLRGHVLQPPLRDLLAPYLGAIAACNEPDRFTRYPGSPWIVRHLLRRQDRMTAIELHPQDAKSLEATFAGDVQVRTVALDGWLALGAFVPPKERRGLVLVDPPFEQRDDFERLADTFAKAHARWPTGTYALWYPVKDLAAVETLRETLADIGIRRLLRAELTVRSRGAGGTFNGAGLILCNPPWRFAVTLDKLLGGLVPVLAQGAAAGHTVEQIVGE